MTVLFACAHSTTKSAHGSRSGCHVAQYCWDFETGKIPEGFIPKRNEYNGELVVDSSRAKSGRYALHAKGIQGSLDGGVGGPKKSLVFQLPPDFGPKLWGRAYVYTSPAAPVSHAGIFSARYAPKGKQYKNFEELDWYEIASFKQKYMAIWHPPEPPGFPEWVLLAEKPLVIDRWSCVEWYFDADPVGQEQAADPQLWVDEQAITWESQFVFSVPDGAPRPFQHKADSFSFIELGVILYQGLSTPTDWWFDDLAIGAQRIGCDSE